MTYSNSTSVSFSMRLIYLTFEPIHLLLFINSTGMCFLKKELGDCDFVFQVFKNFDYLQNQTPIGVLRKRYSENMQQIYKRTPMPTCDFNKATFQFQSNFIEITLQHRFSCKFAAYFQNAFC